MKFLQTFCLIAAFGAVAQVECGIFETYTEVWRENVVRPALPDKAQVAEVNYSGKGTIINININDNIENKMGARPRLLKGGPGSNYVRIVLEGKMGYGINSTVVVYGEV